MKGETRLHAETLPTYLELWDAKARTGFLDSLSCYLHNEGHTLRGNSELFDVEWLARSMYARRTGGAANDIDRAHDDVRQEYKEMARIAIECLPGLCDRIGSRYLTAKAAIETELSRARAVVAEREKAR
jgi:hypothetical protein